MPNPPKNRPTLSSRAAMLAAGVQKHLMSVTSFTFAGVAYTPAELVQTLQDQVAAVNQVAAARGAWNKAIKTDADLRIKVDNIFLALREQVRQMFPNDPEALADFGFSPKKARRISPDAHVVAAAKAKSTRRARGTMGRKQKAAIKGPVPETVTLTPPLPAPPVAVAVPPPSTHHASPAAIGVSTTPAPAAVPHAAPPVPVPAANGTQQ